MRKVWIRIGAIIISLILIIAGVLVGLFWNEIRTLSSLKKIDDYGMFRMTYYGDYGFSEFLKVGAESDDDIEAFVTKRLLKGLPIQLDPVAGGCTAFVVKNEQGEIVFGRNFDFGYAPSMQLYTNPDDGYASVSTVNLSFAGYSEEDLPKGLSLDSFMALAAPFLPFDGMNEKGVAIALLAVPDADPEQDASKVTLNTTTSIRLVLDYAADVDEAVALLEKYNIYFSGDVECHFLIADVSGRSVIVEYYDGAMQVVETEKDYQIASNFIAYNGVNIGEGYTEFERYDDVESAILAGGGVLSEDQSVDLLAEIGIMDGDTDKLQWSVVYNLTTGKGRIFAHRNTDDVMDFQLGR